MPPIRGVERVQDPVHGLMEFQGQETAVISCLGTPELQRLRRLRQLGMGSLVFPGAEHSRFGHSLGAAHLAIRFCRQLRGVADDLLAPELRPDGEVTRDVAIAALCHDLGHGPLSHAWEREVVFEYDRTAWAARLGVDLPRRTLDELSWHELVTYGLIGWPDGHLHQLLETHDTGLGHRIQQMLLGKYSPATYVPRLLSSDVDVDRCDFLLRDAHYTGVTYGRYDLDWLVSTVGLAKGPSSPMVVGFDYVKASRVVEQFLVARRALYDVVYNHRTVRIAEGMVGLVLKWLKDTLQSGVTNTQLERWLPANVRGFRTLRKALQNEALAPEEVMELDDQVINEMVFHLERATGPQSRVVRDLAGRVANRQLFKVVPVNPSKLSRLRRREEQLEEALRPEYGQDARYYYYISDFPFTVLSRKEKHRAYFVRSNEPDETAEAITEHPHLAEIGARKDEEPPLRLYAPRSMHKRLEEVIEKVA